MTQKFKVTRQVLFDRLYNDGDTYEGNVSDVQHLVDNGVLVPVRAKTEAKAEAAPKNKAQPAPKNKSA